MSDERDKKRRGIFDIITPHVNRAEAFLFLFLCFLLILAYVIPSSVHYVPYGTDVYSHLFMTQEMSSANSLSDFYENCFEKNFLAYDYPFGLWLFGSTVAKITGMGMLELSRILPFTIMLVLMILYYSYAQVFGVSKEQALLPMILLVSMPSICLGILGYSTSIFVRSFLIFILYLMLMEKLSIWKRVLLMTVFIFSLCFTHTGTFIFLLSLTLVFIFIYAILYGNLHRDAYIATASIVFVYIITMRLFPYVHPQYIDKGRILVSVGDFFASHLHVPFASELAQTFYNQIFVALNPLYVVLGCLSIYAICKLLMFLRSKIKLKISVRKIREKLPDKFFSVPIIGSIKHVSHSALYWPFWLGPFHVVLAAIGVFKTNRNGLCMLLAVAIVTLLPGHMAGERALREIEYFFIILPVLAALGFYHARAKIETHVRKKGRVLRKAIAGIMLFAIFSSIIVLPVVANIYYHPRISGADYERTGLGWLSGIGNLEEGCAGSGYRHMISVYGNKMAASVTSVASGSDMTRFIDNQCSICFQMNSEEHADDLYATFSVNYQIVSERVLRNLGGTAEQLRIDYNKKFDKIYSSPKYFSIYRYILPIIYRANITPQLNFADDAIIEDAGGSYLVETGEYKVRISKATPGMLYIGNKTTNFFGEGGFYDYILITWSGPHSGQVNGYVLHELSYPTVILGDNQIIYKNVLKNENETEEWATLTVKYTFFEHAMKREIIVANDWVKDSGMNARVTTMLSIPMNHFIFQNENNPAKKRMIYPCEDTVPLNKIKFNRIFINDSTSGIYIEYEKTAPYPNRITYSGLISYIYEYYSMDMSMEKSVSPSETMHLTQWISIGDEQTAKSNVEHYSSVSLYPYPNGEIPIILTSDMGSLNKTTEDAFNATLNAHEKFREVGVANYTEAVNVQDVEINTSRMSKLLERGSRIIGCEDVEGCNITVQEEKIEKMKENAQKSYNLDIKGFMPKDLQYDLDTIRVLADKNLSFIVAKKIMPAFDIYFQEGFRQPQITYYRGDKTGVILLPISEPTIGGPAYFYDDYPTAWKAVIDSVIKNGDLCVFLWDSEKAGMPEHINDTINVIRYAKERGMTFTTPYEIANHFSLLQNVSAVVSKNDDESTIIISIRNENEEPVYGVTFKVETHGTAEYAVNNGQILRKASSGTKWIYYVSTDLAPKETKEIVLDVLGYR